MEADTDHLTSASGVCTVPGEELTREQIVDALDFAKQYLRENANVGGYGFYRPANPHDFFPDHESCSPEEIANHKAACEAWDRGEYKRDDWDGWLYDDAGKPTMHVLRAPWGIGSYSETDAEMEARALVLHRLSEAERIAQPPFRGYVRFGAGAYILTVCEGDENGPELVISVATEEQKAGRTVGDLRDVVPGAEIPLDRTAVRLQFASLEGLDALEQQLAFMRDELNKRATTPN